MANLCHACQMWHAKTFSVTLIVYGRSSPKNSQHVMHYFRLRHTMPCHTMPSVSVRSAFNYFVPRDSPTTLLQEWFLFIYCRSAVVENPKKNDKGNGISCSIQDIWTEIYGIIDRNSSMWNLNRHFETNHRQLLEKVKIKIRNTFLGSYTSIRVNKIPSLNL